MARVCPDSGKSLLQNGIDKAAELAAWRFQGRQPIGDVMYLQKIKILAGRTVDRQAATKRRLG